MEVNFLQLETHSFDYEIFKSLLLKYHYSLWLSPTRKARQESDRRGERHVFTTDAENPRKKKGDEVVSLLSLNGKGSRELMLFSSSNL